MPADPIPWILASDEPYARLAVFLRIEGRPAEDAEVRKAKAAVLADPGVRSLIDRLPDWESETVCSGHNSPSYTPNLIHLLADLGLARGDSPRVDRILNHMLRHQDGDGRFLALGRWRNMPGPVWGALFCDAHSLADLLIRFGFGDEPRVKRALDRMAADMSVTAQGPGWLCRPDPQTKFRGPGRKDEICPQVTLEALRAFGRVPKERRPSGVMDAARSALDVWRGRGVAKPYMFGHGRTFKTVKWPPFWYDASFVLDALSGLPDVWRGPQARPQDRRSTAELAAVLLAYNFGPDGRVTPRSCYKGFESFSFGRKKVPSPYATAHLIGLLKKTADLASEISRVDVLSLTSSKGGTGTALPPKQGPN
ncbi:MAG: hypothetical protein PHI34_09970 [Acidobacteriota bacterium]|nr:hypothetical protein [Acidobacteriota bacterium]